jgi:hypothetical protein
MAIQPTGAFPFDATFKYPLPAAILAIPVASAGPFLALGIFAGASTGVFAYSILRSGGERWPLLLSAPMMITVLSGQWSALLSAGFLLPTLSIFWVCKPTLGAALWLGRPTIAAVVGGTVLIALSFVLLPSWPAGWLLAVKSDPAHHYLAPITLAGGPIILLALLRWRQAEARLLIALACVPQALMFYNALPVLLAARTRRESMIAATLASLGWFGWSQVLGDAPLSSQYPVYAGYWMLGFAYLPALIMVLRRREHGSRESVNAMQL